MFTYLDWTKNVSTRQREDEYEYNFNTCGQHFVSEIRFKGRDKKPLHAASESPNERPDVQTNYLF